MLAALSQSKVDTPCHKCFHFCLLEYRYIGSYWSVWYRVPSTDTTGTRLLYHPVFLLLAVPNVISYNVLQYSSTLWLESTSSRILWRFPIPDTTSNFFLNGSAGCWMHVPYASVHAAVCPTFQSDFLNGARDAGRQWHTVKKDPQKVLWDLHPRVTRLQTTHIIWYPFVFIKSN